MSNAKIKTVSDKRKNYIQQNGSAKLTRAQARQLRKTRTRLDNRHKRDAHRETKRNRRQKFRDWMAGMRG